jgi:hypothetical protein
MRTLPNNCSINDYQELETLNIGLPLEFDIDDEYTCTNLQSQYVFEKIQSFRNLKLGWRYGEGGPVNEKVTKAAIELYCKLLVNLNFSQSFKVNAMPNADGGITLSYGHNDNFIELVINPNLKIDLTLEKGIGADYDIMDEVYGIDINDTEIILTYLYKICNLLEPFILMTSMRTEEDSQATRSKITMGGFQSLKKNAQEKKATRFAPTFQIFTQTLMETL